MVCHGHNAPLLHVEWVVALAALHPRESKTAAEFHALDGGNGKKRGGKAALQPVEERPAHTGGQTEHGAFHHAAHRVARGFGAFNGGLHVFSARLAERRKEAVPRVRAQLSLVGDSGNLRNAGRHDNAAAGEHLQTDPARYTQRRGHAPGKSAAAGGDRAVFYPGGVIRVTGAGDTRCRSVVRTARVTVVKDRPDGRAVTLPSLQAGEELRLIRLAPGRAPRAAPGGAAGEKGIQSVKIDFLPGGDACERHPDHRGVGFAEDRQLQRLSDGAHALPPREK